MKKHRALLILLLTLSTFTFAQRTVRIPKAEKISPEMKLYQDTLMKVHDYYFGALDSLNNDTVPEREIKWDPYYYKMFVPPTFYYSPFERAFVVDWKFKELDTNEYSADEWLPIDSNRFNTADRGNRISDEVLFYAYASKPGWQRVTEEDILEKKLFKKDIVEKLPPKIRVSDLFQPEPINEDVGEVDILIRKPNFWNTGGNIALQFAQNYISKNWYKGGESTNNLASNLKLEANYNDQEKLEFDNSLEINLGFTTAPSDTVHQYKTNMDVFRINSKLGLRAIARWYYTLSFEFNTQFFSNYKTNSNTKISGFMSPANVVLSIGMDYKLEKKKANLSVLISPLAYNFRYVASKEVDVTAFSIEPGHRSFNEFGCKFQTNLKWTVIPAVIWESRLYYFSNYKRVEAEWENTFNFVLNRYLSTKLFVHARFDDGVKPVDDHSYFQLKELLSFGINYKW